MGLHQRLIRYKAEQIRALDMQTRGEDGVEPVEEYEDNAFVLISEMNGEELCAEIEEMMTAEASGQDRGDSA